MVKTLRMPNAFWVKALFVFSAFGLWAGCFNLKNENTSTASKSDVGDSGSGSVTSNGLMDSGLFFAPVPDAGTAPEAVIDAGVSEYFSADAGVLGSHESFLPLDVNSCAALCEARTSSQANGLGACEFEWLSGDCETRCMEFAAFNALTESAFAWCTLNDPLCYQDIEQCVWSRRYPWPEALSIPVSFIGTGFDDFSGLAVVIVMHPSGNMYDYAPAATVSSEGSFSVNWNVDFNPSSGSLFLYYIDVDQNGHCNTPVDYGGSLHGEMGPDWDNPTFAGEEMYDNNNHEFVCDYID